jgi:hypothetical protein
MSLRRWVVDRSLGIFFLALFLLSWIGQLVVQWFEYVDDQQELSAQAEFWSSEFWVVFWQATFENWQSEFLQLSAFVIAAAYLVYKGSSESGDSDERIEAKLDALLRERGVDPAVVDDAMQEMYKPTAKERALRGRASTAPWN